MSSAEIGMKPAKPDITKRHIRWICAFATVATVFTLTTAVGHLVADWPGVYWHLAVGWAAVGWVAAIGAAHARITVRYMRHCVAHQSAYTDRRHQELVALIRRHGIADEAERYLEDRQ